MAKPSFIILSCDGGGVRGLITAMLLQSLDAQVLQNVSLFSGTSTGSIIALGLAAGVPIAQIVDLYQSMSNCNEIFTPYLGTTQAQAGQTLAVDAARALPRPAAGAEDSWWWEVLQLVAKAAAEMAFPKYRSSGLGALLSSKLPDMTLQQLASQRGKHAVVPSFRITAEGTPNSWAPVLFHNLPGLTKTPELAATKLVDTAMCSAAAPLFFPPHVVGPDSFIDGGVFANNPSSTAVAAYFGSSLAIGSDGEGVALVSIGTGDVMNSYPSSGAVFPNGILGWLWPYQDGASPAFPLIQAMFAGTSKVDELTASMMLRKGTYIRGNPIFEQTWSLDDCSAIPQMMELTNNYIGSDSWKPIRDAINALAAG